MEAYTDMKQAVTEHGLGERIRLLPYAEPAEYTPGTQLSLEEIEQRTCGRADNPEWFACTYGRITASDVGSIIACTERRGDNYARKNSLSLRCLAPGKVRTANEEILHEKDGIFEYAGRLDEDEHVVIGSGLIVHPQHPWLVCSPCGLYRKNKCMTRCGAAGEWLYCDCPPTYQDRLVEVKCSYSGRGVHGKKSYLRKVRDTYELDMTSVQGRGVYYQIQTALACMDLPDCDLVVWTPRDTVVIHVERQTPDDEAKMINILHEFWLAYVDRKRDAKKFRRVVEQPECLSALMTELEGLMARMRTVIPAPVTRCPRLYPYEYTYPYSLLPDSDCDNAVDGEM
jgi:hypothetical protein